MSKSHQVDTRGNGRGKSQLLAMSRDAALKAGKTVAVANLVDGKVHFCIVKPFRRPTTPGQPR